MTLTQSSYIVTFYACTLFFYISAWVVEKDLDAFSLRASEFLSCRSSFLIFKARYSNVITKDSEDSKSLSFLAPLIILDTILMMEE